MMGAVFAQRLQEMSAWSHIELIGDRVDNPFKTIVALPQEQAV
jgi:hypothetical protein